MELCWCYLQDGKIAKGIRLALEIEKKLPSGKEAEWNGLMAKLYVEEAEYEDSITMTHVWEEELHKKLQSGESEEEQEKDRDRLKQAHMIRMQCYHNLGFRDEEKFAEAIREGEAVLEGNAKDIGILLEMAQIYTEMQEYEKCEEVVSRLVEDYQVYAAYAASMEAYRRQLDPKVFQDAEKNGVKSDILEAYKYQKTHKVMELDTLNKKLKAFRKEFRKPVEEGQLSFYETGLEKLTRYLYNCPDSYMFVERGIFHRSAHHYEEAKEDFEKALTLDPDNPYALNGLSFVYKYLGDYEKALFYIKKAILYIDEEMSPVIYTDMADLYSLMGDFKMALAACGQYEEKEEKQRIGYLNQLADTYINLGEAERACEIHGRYADKNKWKSYEKQVDAFVKCGVEIHARKMLEKWAWELKQSGGVYSVLYCREGKAKRTGSLGVVEPFFGGQEDVAAYAAEMNHYLRCQDRADGVNGKLADLTFACIVCGMDKQGREYSKELRKWLQEDKFSAENTYFNQEKGLLEKKILAAWYTTPDEGIQALLDKEEKCGICHFCTNPVCKEVEAMRILFLIRQGKKKEAKERLEKSLEIQPSDEFMLAIRHMVFEDR